MITENLSTLKIHKLTKEQYEREVANGNIDETALYLTPDEEVYATIEQVNNKADISHTHEVDDISGVLPIANGGTGATNIKTAIANLGVQSKITYGTAAPSGGSHGDVYIQIV